MERGRMYPLGEGVGPGARLGRRRFLVVAGGAIAFSFGVSACADDDDAGESTGGDLTASDDSPPVTTTETDDATFILKFDPTGDGPRLAVKDLIDVAGVVTTAGCAAVAESASPATLDASCLEGARAAGVQLVGKTNLSELAMDTWGINEVYGTPVNPLDASLIPGGSSSGSAVAVATDLADVAYGTDTAGSIRVPAACCGVAGLKTTFGRVPLDGVYPLAPSLDTVGPLARDISGVVTGMRMLEPSFEVARDTPTVVGRVRGAPGDGVIDPRIDAAVDAALAAAAFEVIELDLVVTDAVISAFYDIILSEGAESNRSLLSHRESLTPPAVRNIEIGLAVTDDEVAAARATLDSWSTSVNAAFDQVEILALPTLPFFPPSLDQVGDLEVQFALASLTSAWNAAGLPVLALPVPVEPIPAGIQLVGPMNGEEILLAAGAVVEAAVSP